MSKGRLSILLTLALLVSSSFQSDWGFFGHRRINHLAVFTLPPPLIGFYKKHIDYLTEHAIDPDKRRYASRFEAERHYIDLDVFGTFPFENLPRHWFDALFHFAEIHIIDDKGDTSVLIDHKTLIERGDSLIGKRFSVDKSAYRDFFYRSFFQKYYDDNNDLSCDTIFAYLGTPARKCRKAWWADGLSEHGILPYHLNAMQRRLTEAFMEKNIDKILRLSADFGHYIADAHVPLHTTRNYNGQLTDQLGIHAFWESRIPELFADAAYDFFVGTAQRLDAPADYFWDIVFKSHTLVDDVLTTEKTLSQTFPKDRQYCMVDRQNQMVRLECPEYAAAYHTAMQGMVEERMREAILAVGNAWYTAWLDAGSPSLTPLDTANAIPDSLDLELEKQVQKGKTFGRQHDN